MDAQSLFFQFAQLGAHEHLLAVLLGLPRLFMLLTVAPFFGSSIITGQLRAALVTALYLPLHPALVAEIETLRAAGSGLALLAGSLLFKEAFIGMLMGYLAGILFWTVQSAGYFIDTQRGASQAQIGDPLNGDETTPMGSLFFHGTIYLFFTGGAFLAFLGAVYASYEVWPVTAPLPTGLFSDMRVPLFFVGQLSRLMSSMLLLAGPVAVACLLTDISLGLINRAAQQLNVYVLAMPIKSAVAAFLLVFYFGLVMTHARHLFSRLMEDLDMLGRLLP